MILAFEFTDPLHIRNEEVEYFRAPDGLTVRELLERMTPGFTEFEHPTICLVNSEPWLRDRWNDVLPIDARVAFVRLAGTWEWIIVYLVIAIVSVVLSLLLAPDQPTMGTDLANGDPVYTLSGQRNQIKLNDPIEAAYGRCRLWPAYAARPYNVYDGNQQYQFSLYCLGQGHVEIHDMRFEDTPLENFDEVDYQIVPPGADVTLFADNVDTSSAVSNVELFGPNEDEFRGWVGPFTANEPLTKTNRIEIDVSLPAGLYSTDEDDGDLRAQAVEVAFQYRQLTDNGSPVGDWKPLVFSQKRIFRWHAGLYSRGAWGAAISTALGPLYAYVTVPHFYKSLATVTPQRFTLGADVPLGRYEVRAQRINNKNKARSASNVVRWEALRAFFPSVQNYGNVTLVAVKARATNNLNNNAAQKFNVIATRCLPIWNESTGQWSEPVPTRNPVWAYCDVFRSLYGGRLSEQFLDLEELNEMAEFFEANRINFDYIFDQKVSVWEAARTIAKVGRCIPMLSGSLITMVRDEAKITATAVFNPHNIVLGSMNWSVKLRDIEEHDGIEIIYMDEETWKEETVLCLIGNDEGTQPRQVRFPGCTDRTRAYREGLYMRATELFLREKIEFKTGLEGHLPRYGDMILVSHDIPRWGVGGLVLGINGTSITLDRPVTFEQGIEHRIVLRKKDGSAYGPFPVVATANDSVVTATQPIVETFYFDEVHEPPYFIFSSIETEAKKCVVVGIDPENDTIIKVTSQAYDPRVFAYDAAVAPPRGVTSLSVTDPSRPVVSAIKVTSIPGTSEFILISWPPALGARNYLLEQSQDGMNWSRAVTLPSNVYELRVVPGMLYVRVAGVNVDIGPWISWFGRVGDVNSIPGTVLGLEVIARGNGYVTIRWNSLVKADSYDVSVFETLSGKFLRKVNTTLLTFTYTWENSRADGLDGYDITFRVKGLNILGNSENSAILNTYLTEPGLTIGSIRADSTQVSVDTILVKADKT